MATGQAVDLRDAHGAPVGQQAKIGAVTLGPAPERWAYENLRPWQLTPVDASRALAGYAVDKLVTSPGGTLGVTLGWVTSSDVLGQQPIGLQLVQSDHVLAEDSGPALQGRPLAGVPDGQLWLDHRLLAVNRDAQSGPAEIILAYGGERIPLQQITISGFERVTQRPDVEYPLEATFGDTIRLLGYAIDAPSPLTSESTINLTLIWQALGDGLPEASYKVFTQILGADGRLVGQHDGMPAYESRPFSSWLAHEYIIDEHQMRFKEPYTGPVRIQIGLYDPASGIRILTSDETDAVLLPMTLDVLPE
jgi:hypothetical protein